MQMLKIDTIILTQKDVEKFELIQNHMEVVHQEKYDIQDVAIELIRLGMAFYRFN